MGYPKLIREKYNNPQDVINLVNYILNYNKCGNMLFSSRNLIVENGCYNPVFIADQLLAAQYSRITSKSSKRLYHIIISLDMNIEGANNYGYILDDMRLKQKNVNLLMNIGNTILNLYPDYQSFFAIHEDKRNLHIHIVFNNCAIMPDKKTLTHYYNHLHVENLANTFVDREIGLYR